MKMIKNSSAVAEASRDIGVNVATTEIGRRSPVSVPLVRSIYRRARHWIAGRRADIQIITVQRSEFSIIT
jgi:hypothetical protein